MNFPYDSRCRFRFKVFIFLLGISAIFQKYTLAISYKYSIILEILPPLNGSLAEQEIEVLRKSKILRNTDEYSMRIQTELIVL